MADVLLVFWSGTGNTEMMAEKIKEGLEGAGASVDYRKVDEVSPNEISKFEKIVFGCPSMGVELLEEDEFEPFFQEVETKLSGKKVAIFGSYGWGEGEWMEGWIERINQSGATLYETGLKVNSTPSSEEEETCVQFGEGFAKF